MCASRRRSVVRHDKLVSRDDVVASEPHLYAGVHPEPAGGGEAMSRVARQQHPATTSSTILRARTTAAVPEDKQSSTEVGR